MERKILKWSTCTLGFFTVMMCVCLYFMPTVKGGFLAAVETMPENIQQAPITESKVEISDTVVVKDEKLNIELPDGNDGDDVQIVNDYVNRTVYVRFAKGVKNYSENYVVRGSSNHIANLSYYRDGEAGVLELNLDKVCEHFYSFEDGFLCIEFKDLHEAYDKIVVVDAGHGGKMPGAVKKNIIEKNLNLDIVLKLKEIVDKADNESIKVLYTRLEDVNPSYADRVGLANKLEADLFISVHNNASSSGKFNEENGTMVLYSPDETDDSSKRLAQICLDNVTASAGSKRMGLVKANDIYIVRESEVPVALIEVGFMTNTKELDNLCSDTYQYKVAQGIYNAILAAFEEGF